MKIKEHPLLEAGKQQVFSQKLLQIQFKAEYYKMLPTYSYYHLQQIAEKKNPLVTTTYNFPLELTKYF